MQHSKESEGQREQLNEESKVREGGELGGKDPSDSSILCIYVVQMSPTELSITRYWKVFSLSRYLNTLLTFYAL